MTGAFYYLTVTRQTLGPALDFHLQGLGTGGRVGQEDTAIFWQAVHILATWRRQRLNPEERRGVESQKPSFAVLGGNQGSERGGNCSVALPAVTSHIQVSLLPEALGPAQAPFSPPAPRSSVGQPTHLMFLLGDSAQ